MSVPDRSGPVQSLYALLGTLLLGGVLGLLSGCSGFSPDEPLPDSTFTRVLTEFHLAKARHSIDAPYPSNLRDSIFARYEVHPSEFEATLQYYSRRPKAFETLYRSIIDTLQALQYSGREGGRPGSVPDSVARNYDQGGTSE